MEKWNKKRARQAGVSGQTQPIHLPAPSCQLQGASSLTLARANSAPWAGGEELKLRLSATKYLFTLYKSSLYLSQVHLPFLKFHTKTVGQRKLKKNFTKKCLRHSGPSFLRCLSCTTWHESDCGIATRRAGNREKGDKEPAALGDKRMDISRQMVRCS